MQNEISRLRITCLLLVALLLSAMDAVLAQPNTTMIPYLDTGYKYMQATVNGVPGFEATGFDDSAWPTGDAGFGSIGGCPLNNATYVKTSWAINTDMLVRKRFNLPGGARNVVVSFAIDNDVQAFFNGQDISGGLRTHEGCATRGNYVFAVPNALVLPGENILAVRARDRGGESYLDLQVTADIPVTVLVTNTLDAGPGSLRDALATTNTSSAIDTIKFNIPGGGVQTIELASSLPDIVGPVVIDGTTQPGYAGTPLVAINGIGASEAATGFRLNAGSSTVKGLLITGFDGDAIRISGLSNNVVFGNTITGNHGAGVVVQSGQGNLISRNSILENGGLGIDLNGDGVTANQPPARPPTPRPLTSSLPNFGQNYPVLYYADAESSRVRGSINTWPDNLVTIEVFRNGTVDPSGFGEGETFIGSTTVRTDANGNAIFSIPSSLPLSAGQFIAATATDSAGNTSEFSGSIIVGVRSKIYGDHYVVNTTLSGIPLHWAGGNGTYSLSASIPPTFVAPLDASFATWSALPQLSYTNVGQSSSNAWGGSPDGVNNVAWITNNWGAATGADPATIAVTRVRYNTITGEFTDVDIAFNAENFVFNIAPPNPIPADTSGKKDVQNVATHEVGHYSGLGDIYDPGYPQYVPFMGQGNDFVTMFGFIRNGEVSKRSLHDPDTAGIGYIFRNIPQSSVDVVLVFDGAGSFTTTQHAFDPAKNSATELVQKLRVGDRIGVVRLPNTVVLNLTTIQNQASRTTAMNAINGMTSGGTSFLGQGVQTGLGLMTASPLANQGRAMILFSAGDNNGSPDALSLVPALRSAQTHLYTMGFAGSQGQDLSSKLADSTGGTYHLASDTTLSQVVNEIWNTITGTQLLADTTFLSNAPGLSWQGGLTWQGGLSWQGAVDPGTTVLLPGLSWQGSTFLLSLLSPIPGDTITPFNYTSHPGVQYFAGPTFAFYRITNAAPGTWTLHVNGDNTTPPPPVPEALRFSLLASSDVTMTVKFNKFNYALNDVVGVEARLSAGGQSPGGEHTSGGGPITDALVQADVVVPGMPGVQTIALGHVGAGIYTGSFNNTSVGGSYKFTIRARGVLPAVADSFKRQVEQSVFVLSPFSTNAVAFATNSITLGEKSVVNSGDIIVNEVRAGSQVELKVKEKASTPSGFSLRANRITVDPKAQVGGDVYFNVLSNGGTIAGALFTPLNIPVVLTLPAFESSSPGTQNITVATKQTMTLAPGSYGDVTIQPQATLRLGSGGTYQFKSITAKSKSKLLATAPTHVRVLNTLSADNETYIGPAQGSPIDASGIIVYVGSSSTQAIEAGPKADLFANFYAPNGTIRFKEGTEATGAFLAKDLDIGAKSELTLSSAFTGILKAGSRGWLLEPDAQPVAELPTSFALMQNFPNPFNPTTTIRYQLPEQRDVNITVFNLLGQAVRTLVNQTLDAGTYGVVWDGRNDQGQLVGSGVFFYRMKAGGYVEQRKMIMVK